MSKESHNINNYLQFTPLTSGASARSLINCFATPKARVDFDNVRGFETSNADPAQVSEDFLSRVLRRAIETRDYFDPAIINYDSQVKKDRGQVAAPSLSHAASSLLRSLDSKDVMLRDRSLTERTHDASVVGKPLETSQANAPVVTTSAVPDAITASAPTTNVHHSTFAVEILSPANTKDRPVVGDSAQNKRTNDKADLPYTPTKAKKVKSMYTSPSKLDSPQKLNVVLLASQRAEIAMLQEQFENVVDDIFEADDSLQEDTSGSTKHEKTQLMYECGTEKCLTLEAAHRLQKLLKSLLSSRLAPTVQRDAMLRLQRILLRSLQTCDSSRLQVLEADMTIGEEHAWEEHVVRASSAMLCSIDILSLNIVTTGDNNTYAEEAILSSIDCTKAVLEDLFFRWFSGVTGDRISIIETHKSIIDAVLQSCVQFFTLLSFFFANFEISEDIQTRAIFLAVQIVFVDSPGKANRVCSSLIFESLKSAAVSALQNLFSRFPKQRQFILDEILSSLNKLPANRQSARQYKLGDGKNIQLTSALLLHLVQASCTSVSSIESPLTLGDGDDEDETPSIKQDIKAADEMIVVSPQLAKYEKQYGVADQVARYIINFLLEKFLKTKSTTNNEDVPFKALLDVFIEDFVLVLLLPEWPAAELMLRWIATSMLKIIDNSKQGAQIRVSAVDALSSIACKIRSTTILVHKEDFRLRKDHPNVQPLAAFAFTDETTPSQMDVVAAFQKTICDKLLDLSRVDHIYRAAYEFSVNSWLRLVVKTSVSAATPESCRSRLLTMAQEIASLHESGDNALWTKAESENMAITSISRMYLQTLTFSELLHMFDTILPRLLTTMDSPQISLRTKTLRSFARLAEVDSTILAHRAVFMQITSRLSDTSPQVRDIALDLLGKHIAANPHLGHDYYPVLRERIMDTGLSVRKRVLRLCKDLYMNNKDQALQFDIASNLLQRLHDEEESIQEIVAKSFEVLWFSSITANNDSNLDVLTSLQKQDLKDRATIISLVAADLGLTPNLTELLSGIAEKTGITNLAAEATISLLIQSFLEDIVSDAADVSRLKSLIALKTFATATSRVFLPAHMDLLLPYLQFGTGKFETNAPFYVASIYTAILPILPSKNMELLSQIQASLLAQLTKMPTRTLNEVVPCLCMVASLKGETVRVAKTVKSCLQRLQAIKQTSDVQDPVQEKQIILLMHLVGLFGRYLSIDKALLIDTFGMLEQEPFIELLMSSILRFCQTDVDSTLTAVGRSALQSLGNFVISYPKLFQDQRLLQYTDTIMKGSQQESKRVLINLFIEYLSVEQKKNDNFTKEEDLKKQKSKKLRDKPKKGHVADVDVGVLTGDTDKFATDGISPALMQRYLPQILSTALGRDVSMAMSATTLINSIVGQGLANPRSCVPTIVALETSKEPRIQDLASHMHRSLYEKHESLIDSCYITGVKASFRYRSSLYSSALPESQVAVISTLYSIVRASRRGRQRFLTSLTKGLDTDIDRIHVLGEEDIHYAKFVAHNLACLDYSTNEEIHIVIQTIDKILSTSGAALQQSLEDQANLQEQAVGLAKAALILSYAIQLREQLKLVYNISETKCRAFEATKLGSRADTKTAIRRPQQSLIPEWDDLVPTSSPQYCLQSFTTLFSKQEHETLKDDDSSNSDMADPPVEQDSGILQQAQA